MNSHDEDMVKRLSILKNKTNTKLTSSDKEQILRAIHQEMYQMQPRNKRKIQVKRLVSSGVAIAGVVIVAAGVLVLHGHTNHKTLDKTTAANHTKNHNTTVAKQKQINNTTTLTGIHMFNSKDGWMIGNKGSILRTTNGGVNWNNVTPKFNNTQNKNDSIAVLNTNVAWIAANLTQNKHSYITIFKTTNGGSSWTKTIMNQTNQTSGQIPASITFSSLNNGWLVTKKTNKGTGGTQPGRLYRTTDGGKTWTFVSQAITSNIVRFNWIYFLDAKQGFTSGTHQANADTGVTSGNTSLYETTNGGSSWEKTSLNSIDGKLMNPKFFSSQTGVIPIVSKHGNSINELQLYDTSNGGKTWTKTGVKKISHTPIINFISQNEGFVLENNETISLTVDGGQHWTTTGTIPSNLKNDTVRMDFINKNDGWLYASPNTFMNPNSHKISVFKTSNGGHTWKQVK